MCLGPQRSAGRERRRDVARHRPPGRRLERPHTRFEGNEAAAHGGALALGQSLSVLHLDDITVYDNLDVNGLNDLHVEPGVRLCAPASGMVVDMEGSVELTDCLQAIAAR